MVGIAAVFAGFVTVPPVGQRVAAGRCGSCWASGPCGRDRCGCPGGRRWHPSGCRWRRGNCCWRPGSCRRCRGGCLRGDRGFRWHCFRTHRTARRRPAGCRRSGGRGGGDGGSVVSLLGFSAGAGDPPDDDQRDQAAKHGQYLVASQPRLPCGPTTMSGGRSGLLARWLRLHVRLLVRRPPVLRVTLVRRLSRRGTVMRFGRG
jgi:hypothetical protein